MAKSADAFRTISEVADWLGVQTHVLRFWESKFTQVKPVKRAGGRRYYRPADMQLLGGIQKLLHEDGLTIKGAQKILREKGILYAPDYVINAGGIINVYAELENYDRQEIIRKTENIYNTTLEILDNAKVNNLTTHDAALNIARERIETRKRENSK